MIRLTTLCYAAVDKSTMLASLLMTSAYTKVVDRKVDWTTSKTVR
jgi:hypothetical protein